MEISHSHESFQPIDQGDTIVEGGKNEQLEFIEANPYDNPTLTQGQTSPDTGAKQPAPEGNPQQPSLGEKSEGKPAKQIEPTDITRETNTPGEAPNVVSELPKKDPVENGEALLARRRYEPRNPLNPYDENLPEWQPKDTQNPIGNELIQDIRDIKDEKGVAVRVEWTHEAQIDAGDRNAIAVTHNFNKGLAPEDRGAHLMVVALGPDSTNAAVYEEYLHVKEAESRDWGVTESFAENYCEEIRVEQQVLKEASSLNMSSKEFDRISEVRNEYIKDLKTLYTMNERKSPKLEPEDGQFIRKNREFVKRHIDGDYSKQPPKPRNLT